MNPVFIATFASAGAFLLSMLLHYIITYNKRCFYRDTKCIKILVNPVVVFAVCLVVIFTLVSYEYINWYNKFLN